MNVFINLKAQLPHPPPPSPPMSPFLVYPVRENTSVERTWAYTSQNENWCDKLLALPLNQGTENTKVAKSLNFVPVNKCDIKV